MKFRKEKGLLKLQDSLQLKEEPPRPLKKTVESSHMLLGHRGKQSYQPAFSP